MKVLLIIPPFTQLNTVYPSTAYIKGFLNTLQTESFQLDLSIEVILRMFTREGIIHLFATLERDDFSLSENAFRVFANKRHYIHTIDSVISFLQNKNPTLAYILSQEDYLPRGHRFDNMEDLEWAFGDMGIHDKARHLCTLYLEDLGDLIAETVDEDFSFSRYAERIARTATSFDEMLSHIVAEDKWTIQLMKSILKEHIDRFNPDLVCLSVPFPGNLLAAFKCGQWIKLHHPHIKVALGGGYANTELRSVYDSRVFDFVDFITLDDGEAPLAHLIEYMEGNRVIKELKRTFLRENGQVQYMNGSKELDIPQRETGTPDYSDLRVNDYLSVIEVVNPMHRLWSDGWWNKLTMAHGCYWGKCSFCDVTLDYISRYEPISASILCDRMESIIHQTGKNGFHFVDEAAPPALMRDLALEIIKRNLSVTWWTNIRFEKSFTSDLCQLLRASGCIAVTGGLEVASDRLLEKMKKGVTVAQVAQVCQDFNKSGIMVHAYLMYGFPTQTDQETIDSLEMVRQMFESGVLQSGFWHQFAMTAHSPVGLQPQDFDVVMTGPRFGGFAENDYYHEDPNGADHEKYSDGLKLSLFNYMRSAGLDEPLNVWFEHKVPNTSVPSHYIQSVLHRDPKKQRLIDRMIWLGGHPVEIIYPKKSKKNKEAWAELIFITKAGKESVFLDSEIVEWLSEWLIHTSIDQKDTYTLQDLKDSYFQEISGDWETFLESFSFTTLRERGWVLV